MAGTDQDRPHFVIKYGERTRTPSASGPVYAIGPDEMDITIGELLNLQKHGSGRVGRTPKARTPASTAIGHFTCDYFLVDVASLVMELSPHQSTVLLRLSIPPRDAKQPILVVEPEHSFDMTQDLLDASIDLVKPPDEVVTMRRTLTQRTVDSVLRGTRWLTSAQLNSIRNDKTSNPSATIGRWLQSGSIFALGSRRTRLIPEYALDQLGEPIALLKPVLRLMRGRTSFLIAAWFESPNSFLNGDRPRELLATRGLDVVKAAEMHVAEDFHG